MNWLPAPLQAYALLIKVGLILSLLGGFGWYMHHMGNVSGKAEIQAQWDKDKIARNEAEKTALAERAKQNFIKEAAQDETNRLIKKGYDHEIAADRAIAAKPSRLLFNRTKICEPGLTSTVQAESTTGSNAGTASTGILPEPYSGNIKQLMLEADEVVASCRALQTFSKENGFVP